MRLIKGTLLGLLALLLSPMAANAVPIPLLDQSNDETANSWFCSTATSSSPCDWQQEVIAGTTGRLIGIELRFWRTGTFGIDLWHGTPWHSSSPAHTQFFDIQSTYEWLYFDLASAAFDVTIGQSFTFGTRGSAAVLGSIDFSYAGITGIRGEACSNDCPYDIGFRTYVAPASVPEPGTLALLGIGLAGMGLARRRKIAAV